MEGSVTTQRTRSPPVRPARPEGDLDGREFKRRSSEFFSPGTPVLQQQQYHHQQQAQQGSSVADGRPSTDNPTKSRQRKSARYSVGSGSAGEGYHRGHERKGSIRNAVRRLFGRKSKGDIPEVPEVPRFETSGHGYHKSDPGQFTRPQTIHTHPANAIQQRTISAPLEAPILGPTSPAFRLQEPPLRNREHASRASPNAVEFPKSSRLKPLDLGNPFYTREHGPKRRATLPSLIMTEHEAASMPKTLKPGDSSRAAGASMDGGPPASDSKTAASIGLAVTSNAKSKMDKRRSRSANDLRQAMLAADPFRDRTGEIEYWRRSYASVVLGPLGKAPVYDYPSADAVPDVPDLPEMAPEPVPREPQLAPVPTPLSAHPPLPRPELTRAPSSQGPSVSNKAPSPQPALRSFSRPLPAPSADAVSELETRVAKLESHIVDFQRSLSTLALSNASALAPTEPPASSHRQRTPSILIDSLQAPDQEFEDAGDIVEREWGPSSRTSTNGDRPHRSAPPTLRANATVANGTFAALYNMLSEERSARRTLENQVRNLQHEVTRLQLSRGSWGSYSAQQLPQSQRPRTPAESDGGRSGSRQEAYNALSSPNTIVPPASYLRAFDRPDGRIVSRFSGDSAEDSEYGSRHRSAGVESGPRSIPRSSVRRTPPNFDHTEPTTPYDAYRTPAEERGTYRFSEDEMF